MILKENKNSIDLFFYLAQNSFILCTMGEWCVRRFIIIKGYIKIDDFFPLCVFHCKRRLFFMTSFKNLLKRFGFQHIQKVIKIRIKMLLWLRSWPASLHAELFWPTQTQRHVELFPSGSIKGYFWLRWERIYWWDGIWLDLEGRRVEEQCGNLDISGSENKLAWRKFKEHVLNGNEI